MTNRDRLRKMSNLDLGHYIASRLDSCDSCPTGRSPEECSQDERFCDKIIAEWLEKEQ